MQAVARIALAAFCLSAAPAALAQGQTGAAAQPTGVADPALKAQVEQIVRDYLINNPELLLEVNDALQKKLQAKLAERRQPVLRELYARDTPYAVGQGDVTVVEFFDYNCPVCRTAFQDLTKLMEADKSVRVIFIDMPIFQDSPPISALSLASAKQQRYFDYHRALLNHKGRVTEADALRIAKEIGLDADKLKKDAASDEIQNVMRENLKLADTLGVNGTPAFFVGDTDIAGAPDDAQQLIDAVANVRENGCAACGGGKKKS
ncbi:MAG: DsbA family protein [Hyphomicrobiales bacterium]|nr:DsbA family protein [Hyphomicrobiales bacterium]